MNYNDIDYSKCTSLEMVSPYGETELPRFNFLGDNVYLTTFFQGMKIIDAYYGQTEPSKREEEDEYFCFEFLLADQKGYLWILTISAKNSDEKIKVTLSQALDH